VQFIDNNYKFTAEVTKLINLLTFRDYSMVYKCIFIDRSLVAVYRENLVLDKEGMITYLKMGPRLSDSKIENSVRP
jgi:hypothetical protein